MQNATPPTTAELDLDKILFSAKIDFISLETPSKLALPTLTGKPRWAQSQQYQRLTIHDPSANDVLALHRALGPLRLLEIEVAVDLRPKHSVLPAERFQVLKDILVHLFARGLDPRDGPGMQNQFRAFYRRLEKRGIVHPFNKCLPRPTDQQLHGFRHDDAQVKCYLKMIDQGIAIEEAAHVARVEVRLSGAELANHGLRTIDDLCGFKFRRHLMPYFRHVKGTQRRRSGRVNLKSPLSVILDGKLHEFDQSEWQRVGVGAFVRGGKRETQPVRLLRHIEINDRIGQALMRLERNFVLERVASGKFVRNRTGTGRASGCRATHFTSASQSPITYQY